MELSKEKNEVIKFLKSTYPFYNESATISLHALIFKMVITIVMIKNNTLINIDGYL